MGLQQFLLSAKKRLISAIHPGNMDAINIEVDKAEDDLSEIRTTYHSLKGRAHKAVEESAVITQRMLIEHREE